ncbi:hypothetical protein YC2023_015402 [Brassica napus]
MSNNSQNLSFNAGQAKGQTQEKASNLMDKTSNAAQSAKESLSEGGQQLRQKAQGATEAIKEKTGLNK